MRTTVRRTVLTASAVTLALAVTACGGGDQDGGDGGDAKAKGGGGPDKPAAKALTAAELEKLVVTTDDLEDHKVQKPGKDDVFEAEALSVERAECEPVARVLSALPAGDPAASAQRLVVQESAAAKKGMPSMEELADMTEEGGEGGDHRLPRHHQDDDLPSGPTTPTARSGLSARCGRPARSAPGASP
ncbi:hypothetical protein LV779_03875 [Streptomyces thinghirensis]|nr:hypothetical protein [Streptomyces thinghirensis]